MHIAALIFPTDRTIRPDTLAAALEQHGYESFWVAEHTHIPLSRRTPYPGGGDLPDMYWRTMDPFVSLTAAASATTTLKVGTGICLVNQHHPINAAKQTASIDVLSGGRFLYGVGVGWNEDEMKHHGVDPSKRRQIARERILATKALWTMDEATFDGDYVSFSPTRRSRSPCSSRTRRSSWAAQADRSPSATSSSTATAGCRSTVAVTHLPTPTPAPDGRRCWARCRLPRDQHLWVPASAPRTSIATATSVSIESSSGSLPAHPTRCSQRSRTAASSSADTSLCGAVSRSSKSSSRDERAGLRIRGRLRSLLIAAALLPVTGPVMALYYYTRPSAAERVEAANPLIE